LKKYFRLNVVDISEKEGPDLFQLEWGVVGFWTTFEWRGGKTWQPFVFFVRREACKIIFYETIN
jgi:hypothetical protein